MLTKFLQFKPSISTVLSIRFLAKECRNGLQLIVINKVFKTSYALFFLRQNFPYHLIKDSLLVNHLPIQVSFYISAYLLVQIIIQARIGHLISHEIRRYRCDIIERLNHQNVFYSARVDKPPHYFIIFICRYQNIWLLGSGRMKVQY